MYINIQQFKADISSGLYEFRPKRTCTAFSEACMLHGSQQVAHVLTWLMQISMIFSTKALENAVLAHFKVNCMQTWLVTSTIVLQWAELAWKLQPCLQQNYQPSAGFRFHIRWLPVHSHHSYISLTKDMSLLECDWSSSLLGARSFKTLQSVHWYNSARTAWVWCAFYFWM